MPTKPIRVSLAVFRECDPSIIYGVYDTLWAAGWFGQPGKTSEQRLFEPRIVAADPGPMELITGVSIVPQDAIADVVQSDIVFIPNVLAENAESMAILDRRMLDWIKGQYARGAQLYAACGGSLVLAEAGLLDGCEAT